MSESSVGKRAITFWDHLAVLLKHRLLVIIYMSIMVVASVIYALLAQQWYESKARMLPPPSQAGGLSSLLPSLAGGALGATALLSDDVNLVLSILESREIRDTVIDHFDWINLHNITSRIDAYDRYNECITWEIDERGLIVVSCLEINPELAAKTVDFVVEHARVRYIEVSRAQARNHRDFLERRLEQNYNELADAEESLKSFQTESGVVVLEDQLRVSVEIISNMHNQLILAEIGLEVAENTLPSTSSQLIRAQKRVEAIRGQLENLEATDEENISDILIKMDNAPEAAMQYVRLYREVELQSTILEFLLPQFEQARIMELKEESNIYVLDWGNIADKRSKPRRSYLVLGWLFASLMVLYPFLLFNEWLIRISIEDPVRYGFIRDTLYTLRPSTFFSKQSTDRNSRSS